MQQYTRSATHEGLTLRGIHQAGLQIDVGCCKGASGIAGLLATAEAAPEPCKRKHVLTMAIALFCVDGGEGEERWLTIPTAELHISTGADRSAVAGWRLVVSFHTEPHHITVQND